jgi:hypothetical protein
MTHKIHPNKMSVSRSLPCGRYSFSGNFNGDLGCRASSHGSKSKDAMKRAIRKRQRQEGKDFDY